MLFCKKILYIFSLCMPFLLMAQNKAEIDSLMTKSLKASQEFDYLKSLELSQQVAEKSAKINYRKGMVNGNFMMAYDLCNIGNYKESINYLKIIQKDFKDSINANPGFNYIVLDLYGRNYLSTNFKRNAIKVFKEQLLLETNLTMKMLLNGTNATAMFSWQPVMKGIIRIACIII